MDVRLPTLNRIPGMSVAPKEKYINDLSKYTIVQLQEILDRESKLLNDKKRLAKLPDKGKRILDLHAKVSKEISSRNDIEKAAQLFSNLNIATEGIKAINKMEWNGKYDPNTNDVQTFLDSDDDDETDPLKIIAHSNDLKKHIKIIKPDKKLITSEDLEDIKLLTKEKEHQEISAEPSIELEPHAIYLCDIESNHENRRKFLPFKTTKTNVHCTDAEKARKQGKHWEITAATPPPIRNRGLKVISLQESIDIQKKQYTALKEVEEKNAAERLETRNKLATKVAIRAPPTDGRNLSEFFQTYREFVESDDGESNEEDDTYEYNSDDEIHDEEANTGGGVSVVVLE